MLLEIIGVGIFLAALLYGTYRVAERARRMRGLLPYEPAQDVEAFLFTVGVCCAISWGFLEAMGSALWARETVTLTVGLVAVGAVINYRRRA